jgi:hypothetical protein
MKDRYIYEGGAMVKDMLSGSEMTIQDAVDTLNANDRVFKRVVEVVELREEAT